MGLARYIWASSAHGGSCYRVLKVPLFISLQFNDRKHSSLERTWQGTSAILEIVIDPENQIHGVGRSHKHLERSIPSSNIDLHSAHCARNLEKCKVCGDMVPKRHAEEHYLSTHAPVACSLCSETMARETLDVHTGENCPQRIVTCEYCEFPLPAVDLFEHQEVCGNRTEYCHQCQKYIRLCERYVHETTCTGVPNGTASAGSSRDERPPERERAPQAPQGRPQGRPRSIMENRHFLFTVAITGVAVILGSLFFQKKLDSTDLQ
ncbi:hypothetical protein V2J09_007263 [Rumex salicifolius]